MKCNNFDGRPYFVNEANEPTAQVLILHGICEHGLRYSDISYFLKKNRITSAFTDHPGHGLYCKSGQLMKAVIDSYSKNDDFNRLSASFLHYRNTEISQNFTDETHQEGLNLQLQQLIDYQTSFLKFLFEEEVFKPELPLIIFGQSLGGLICASMAHRLSDQEFMPEGVILLSPAFGPIAAPCKGKGQLYRFAESLENLFLKKSKEACIKNTFFKLLLLKPALKMNFVKDSAWASQYISDLQEENHLFACDPLIHSKLSLNFLYSIVQTMVENINKAAKFPCPFYIAYGTDDKIVDSKASDRFIENYLKSNVTEKTETRKMDNFMPHELHKSSCKKDIFNEIAAWINRLIEQEKYNG